MIKEHNGKTSSRVLDKSFTNEIKYTVEATFYS